MAGSIWFTDMYQNKIGQLVMSSGVVTEHNSPLLNSDPDSLVLGPDNNIWVSPDAYQDLIRVAPNGSAGAFADGYQTDHLLRGNGHYIYGVQTTGIITQMNVDTGRSSLTNPPTNAFPNMYVTAAVIGPDHNLWLVADGSPTSVIQRVRIPGGAP
jgi:streptogramin lyase